MPTGLFQRSFAGGELSEAISVRADVVKRGSGARTSLNGYPTRSGSWVNRAGTKFVNEVKDSTVEAGEAIEDGVPEHLIPFIFNSEQAYVLEFGEEYIRIHRRGEPIFLTPSAWSGATAYLEGDTVSDAGTPYYCIKANTNNQPPNPTYWYELPAPPSWYTGSHTAMLEIPTPYAAGEITKQNTDQSADVLSIAHKNHDPREFKRYSATRWTLERVPTLPEIDSPSGMAVSNASTAAQVRYVYMVTAVKKDTFEESVLGHVTASTTSDIDSAGDDDIVITATSHTLDTGEAVYISAVTPAAAVDQKLIDLLTGRSFYVTKIDANSFSLDDTAGIDYNSTHSVTWHKAFVEILAQDGLIQARFNTITWSEVEGAQEYNVYKSQGAPGGPSTEAPWIFGYIGSAKKPLFYDRGFEPDYESSPPNYVVRFERDDRHPHIVSYFQQRLLYGQSITDPQGVWMSRSGNFHNFATRSPLLDSDPITFELSGQRVNEIRHLVGHDQLVAFTLGNQIAIRGDQDGVVRPDAINLRVQGQNGANNVRPVSIGADIVYVQARGSIVRSLGYDALREGYDGVDLTVYAQHIVSGLSITDMAYAETPFSLVWAVRSDGVLASMTYLREHEIFGWARHKTYTSEGAVQSNILSVAVIPEDGVDIAYLVVERVINGSTVRYIEKMVRRCTSWEDA